MTAQATAIMLSLVMAFTVFPMSAAAATGNGDDGTAAAEEAVTPDYEPGELIVVTEQNTSKKQMKSIVEGVDGQVDTMSALGDGSKMALIEVEEGSELEAAAELECEDEVLYVQPITAEMINCTGCRIEGVKTYFCDSLCPIRQCALSRAVESCGNCIEMNTCEKLEMVTGNNAEALDRLTKMSRE